MKIYMIAGEPSGDYLGSKIIKQLKIISLGQAEISCVGGDLMKNAGLTSYVDIAKLSVGGIFEIIPHIFEIKKIIRDVAENILETKPDIVLTIDSPGFCFRVAELVRQKDKNIRLMHLVAPSVWAWREKRAKKIAKLYDHLLTLFPFEPPYFTKYGLKTTYVGHPAVEDYVCTKKYDEKQNILLILPGSRRQEIEKLLPTFLQTLKYLNFDRVAIPTLPNLYKFVQKISQGYNVEIVTDEEIKVNLYKSAKCAIVASGTATLQLALSGCPMVVCYKVSNLTYHIVKFLIKIKYISLVNIILNKQTVPELIQTNCIPPKIAEKINELELSQQTNDFKNLIKILSYNSKTPTNKIIDAIYEQLT